MKQEHFKRLIIFMESALLILGLTAVFSYVWHTYYKVAIPLPFWRRGNWAIVVLYAVMLLCFNQVYGGLKIGYLRVMDVLYSELISILFVNAITYIQLLLIGRWKWSTNLTPIITMTLIDCVIIVIWVFLTRYVYYYLYPPRKMLLVYGDILPKDLIKKMDTRRDKYNICGSMHIDRGITKIKKEIPKYEAVIISDLPSHERNLLLKYCYEQSIRCYIEPKLSDIIIMGTQRIHLFDTPLLLSRNMGLAAEQMFFKRMGDVIGAAIMAIVSSPLMLIFALCIHFYDGGPVFYKQNRLTKDGEIFSIYKFRSMCMDSEKHGARLTMKDDDRITPIGKILRRTHLDELPQIFNILKGEMSLVGPRPERPEIAREYRETIPEFDFRLKVKAGLTGYAQIYGKYNTTPYDKLKLDLFYIRNYSFLLDLKLFMLTFKILFQKDNTEGVSKEQKTAIKEVAVTREKNV